MNYKDAALLNDSLDSLGQGLLRKRMLEMQDQDRKAQTGLQQQRLGIDQAQFNAQEAHNKAMESKADQANTLAQSKADAHDDDEMLKSVIGLNATGQLNDQSRAQVNSFLSKHPRFGTIGIQLGPPKKTNPQAGQNSLAQALEKADHYDDLAAEAQQMHDNAKSDPEAADAIAKVEKYTSSAQLLRKLAHRMAEPAPVEKPTIKVKTGGKSSSEPEVTQEMTRSDYDRYQKQNAPAPPSVPANKSELTTGTVYNTARGLAKWDGKQFIPVAK